MTQIISLSKGGTISLGKEDPALRRVLVGLGWDPRSSSGHEFDLDASAFLLGSDGRIFDPNQALNAFVFYGNLKLANGSIQHTGDNRDGQGDGDDEALKVDLARLDPRVQRIVFAVTIHEAQVRHQNFGMIGSAFIRIANEETGREVARYDLTEDASTVTAMIFGELYRYGQDWKFRAVGQGFQGGLKQMCDTYGVPTE
ncbi:TerD family protein [Deinococcus maricopensis]|uniref:Stress protein n=1 Tax=Deinococcus maricopensis (strain DSM 21211 / LMG 22137 / NRRL B-23946 / LB-34) TaxID=709986 RepID=E8U4T5_DEIML|nr:TerD family protein [Deinococcus maricopensis]ADV66074.1 stress protein [Deinococcus maricopensis DSM 21211]